MNMTKSQIEARDAAIDAAAEREGRSIRLARVYTLCRKSKKGGLALHGAPRRDRVPVRGGR
jgi:hypothetical protein